MEKRKPKKKKINKHILRGMWLVAILGLMTGEVWIVKTLTLKKYIPQYQERILDLEDQLSRAILSEPDFFYLSPKDGLKEALEYYNVKNPEIVYAQAVLETGNFKSGLSVKHGNLFGLKRRDNRYMTFDHWSASVIAYRDKVQYKWREEKGEDYYDFLTRIGYAEDPLYIQKLKTIVKNPDNW